MNWWAPSSTGIHASAMDFRRWRIWRTASTPIAPISKPRRHGLRREHTRFPSLAAHLLARLLARPSVAGVLLRDLLAAGEGLSAADECLGQVRQAAVAGAARSRALNAWSMSPRRSASLPLACSMMTRLSSAVGSCPLRVSLWRMLRSCSKLTAATSARAWPTRMSAGPKAPGLARNRFSAPMTCSRSRIGRACTAANPTGLAGRRERPAASAALRTARSAAVTGWPRSEAVQAGTLVVL